MPCHRVCLFFSILDPEIISGTLMAGSRNVLL